MAKKKIKDLTVADFHKACSKHEYCEDCPMCCCEDQCIACFFNSLTEEELNKEIEVD